MSTGKTTLALLLSALLPAGTAWAAGNDTLVYCSEASPESFNPQIASSGPSFVASSQVLYNRLVTFDPVKNTPIPSLATEWHVSEDGKTWTFTLRQGVSSTATNSSNQPAILTPTTSCFPCCARWILSIPITRCRRGIMSTSTTWASIS